MAADVWPSLDLEVIEPFAPAALRLHVHAPGVAQNAAQWLGDDEPAKYLVFSAPDTQDVRTQSERWNALDSNNVPAFASPSPLVSTPRLASSDDSSREEELFVHGQTVAWSCGGVLRLTLTLDAPVLQALVTSFHSRVALCVLHRAGLRVVFSDGSAHSVALPCAMARLWPTPFGLLLERALFSANEALPASNEPMPTHFTLTDPLDELRPLRLAATHSLATMPHVAVLWTSRSVPLLLLYDHAELTHRLCALRTCEVTSTLALATRDYAAAKEIAARSGLRPWSSWAYTSDEQARASLLQPRPYTSTMPEDEEDEEGPLRAAYALHVLWQDDSEALPPVPAARVFLSAATAVDEGDGAVPASQPPPRVLLHLFMPHTNSLHAFELREHALVTYHTWQDVLAAVALTCLGGYRVEIEGQACTLPDTLLILDCAHALRLWSGKRSLCAVNAALLGSSEHLTSPVASTPPRATPLATPAKHARLSLSPVVATPKGRGPASALAPSTTPTALYPMSPDSPFVFKSTRLAPGQARRYTSSAGHASVPSTPSRTPATLPATAATATAPRAPLIDLEQAVGARFTVVSATATSWRCVLRVLPSAPLVRATLLVLRACVAETCWNQLLVRVGPRADWAQCRAVLLTFLAPQVHTHPTPSFPGTADDDDAALAWFRITRRRTQPRERIAPAPGGVGARVDVRLSASELRAIMGALHALYEALKCSSLTVTQSRELAALLADVSHAWQWGDWHDVYVRDGVASSRVAQGEKVAEAPPAPLTWAAWFAQGATLPCPLLPEQLASHPALRNLVRAVNVAVALRRHAQEVNEGVDAHVAASRVLTTLVHEGVTRTTLNTLPMPLSIAISQTLRTLRHTLTSLPTPASQPPTPAQTQTSDNWARAALHLLEREDLSDAAGSDTGSGTSAELSARGEAARAVQRALRGATVVAPVSATASGAATLSDDGTTLRDAVTLARFRHDARLDEARRLLCSARPVVVDVGTANLSDHELLEAQQQRLKQLALRTMAQAHGRALLTLASVSTDAGADADDGDAATAMDTDAARVTEALLVPPLMLNGRVKGSAVSVTFDTSALPRDALLWPHFHNGVAAGLRLAPSARVRVTAAWITYNRPAPHSDAAAVAAHAGVLLALGLHGHLRALTAPKVYEYLAAPTTRHAHAPHNAHMQATQPLTSIALLLGLAATQRGTQDAHVYKLLAVHVPALHPPSSADVEVHALVQSAALVGIGLVHQGSAQRHLVELLLAELNTPPHDDKNFARECYVLSAGIALGLILLGRGAAPGLAALADVHVEQRLRRLVFGAREGGAARVSNLVMEDVPVNTLVTAPAALIALALFYLGSDDAHIAALVRVPDTEYALEALRPDVVQLCALAHALVTWSAVHPDEVWLRSLCPPVLQRALELLTARLLEYDEVALDDDADAALLEVLAEGDTRVQAALHALSGAAFALALKYAGTHDERAVGMLRTHAQYMVRLHARAQSAPEARYAHVPLPQAQSLLGTALVALALVQAGSGDLGVLRMLRQVRKQTSAYALHCAVATATGLLFLGGGRYALRNDASAVAMLLIALYPQWPAAPHDNHAHLQALRALVVLAAEPRCLECRDADTDALVHARVELSLESGTRVTCESPCLLPPLSELARVRVLETDTDEHAYYPRELTRAELNRARFCVHLKRRAYIHASLSHLAHTQSAHAEHLQRAHDHDALALAPTLLGLAHDTTRQHPNVRLPALSDALHVAEVDAELGARLLHAQRATLRSATMRAALRRYVLTGHADADATELQRVLHWLQWPPHSVLRTALTRVRSSPRPRGAVALASALRRDEPLLRTCSAQALLTLAELIEEMDDADL